MAWLHAAPKRHDKDKDPKSRIETLSEDDPANCLPEIDQFINSCFQLSGICLSGGMGITPITWQELDSFVSRSGYILSGWESEQIIKMSRAYCNMSHKANELGCPPPYQEGVDDEEIIESMRDRVAKQWGSFSQNVKINKRV